MTKSLTRRWMFAALLALLADAACADDNGVSTDFTLDTSSGEQIYRHICQGCHMPDGKGAIGAGRYPAFAGNPTLASARYMAATILYGRRDMPSFHRSGNGGGSDDDDEADFFTIPLSDAQIAAVVNYVRTHFGNQYRDKLDAADVAALRHR